MKLQVENVSIHYAMKRRQQSLLAVDRANFCVQAGEFVALVGPSGCGKTSLLSAVAGLTPVTTGQICLDHQPITGPGSDRAMVFQSPSLLPWRTVLRNVAYGLELQGCRADEARQRAQRFINLVGLEGFEDSFPHQLSGGMQQRVNLARALTIEPSLLLLDEPLSALDAQTRSYMQWELQRIWQETRNTALYVTHQISEAIYLADQVLVMSARPGQIKEVVPIELPRPRSLAVQQEPRFNDYERHIWTLLQAEAVENGHDD